ncbi:MAG: SDR family oxidoreductase [Pirellulales bacterium]
MKIVVIGGSGLIGKRLVSILQERGHEVLSASPRSGVNTLTGEGLDAALQGASALVDVSNSPSFAADAVLDFFTRSTKNLLAAAKAAGVRHYVALSVVGADRMPDSAYMPAKVAQERLIQAGGIPYTLLRATQFYEFLGGIADSSMIDGVARVSTALMQPVAAADVSTALAELVLSPPTMAIVELAGPEAATMASLVARYLTAVHDPRTVTADPEALYFGERVDDRSLTPGDRPRLGAQRLEDWLKMLAP